MSNEMIIPGGLQPRKLPTLDEIVNESLTSYEENALTVILNQPPPEKWLKPHPTAKIKVDGQNVPLPYLPIDKVEFLLTKIYVRHKVEIKSVQVIANSVVVTVRLYVINPVTGIEEWHDGVGATPIQTDSGAGAMDWNKAKSNGVQIAAPSAETYAIKDAAEKFGKIFGRDLGRALAGSYDGLLKEKPTYDWEDLSELFEIKKDSVPASELDGLKRIISNKEKTSYTKAFNYLQSL